MNFVKNTGKTIQQAFDEFHAANPEVYHHFCRLVFQAVKAGKKKISSKMILEVIRWEIYLKTNDATLFNDRGTKVQFKINDAYTSRYARKFIEEFPELAGMFEQRRLRS